MPIHFACKHCGQKLNVSSEKAGARAKCPKCGEAITVPQPAAVATAAGTGVVRGPASSESHASPARPPAAKLPIKTAPPGSSAAASSARPGETPARKRIEASVESPTDSQAPATSPPASAKPTNRTPPSAAPANNAVPVPDLPMISPPADDVPPVAFAPPEIAEPAGGDFPFPEYAAYEEPSHNAPHEHELIYIDEDAEAAEFVDRQRVAVSRWVLYSQGVLLLVAATLGFAIGFLSSGGRGAANKNPDATIPQPCYVSGRVLYTVESGQKFPDDGAVVVILRQDEKPNVDEKVNYDGLRPSDPPPGEIHDGVSLIRQLGGAYGRADSKGEFRLRVPDVGKYYVLVLSRYGKRKGLNEFKKSDLAQMGHYFVAAIDFVGDRRYRWLAENVYRDRRLDLVLD